MTAMAKAPVHDAPPEALEAIARRCRGMVRKRAGLAAVGGALPIPGLDLAIDAAVLIALLQEINHEFGLSEAQVESLAPSRQRTVLKAIAAVGSSTVGRAITKALITSIVKRAAARLATKSVVRYVPLVGQAIAGALAYTAVRYIGERHIEDCLAVHAQLAVGKARQRRSRDDAEDGVAREVDEYARPHEGPDPDSAPAARARPATSRAARAPSAGTRRTR